MKPYVAADIETTGLDSSYCQVLELGAVIETDWREPVEQLPTFHTYVYHSRIVGEPYALWLNADILKRIADRKKPENAHYQFLHPDEVLPALAMFLQSHGLDPKKTVIGGKNFGSFDLQFLNKLYGYGQQIAFRHRFVDPAMMFWDPRIDDAPPDSKTCMERSGIPGEVKHTAVEDSQGIIRMTRNKFAHLMN